MARPLMMLYSITSEETAHELKNKILQEFPKTQQSILEQMDLLSIIKTMPEEQKNKW